MNAVDVLIYVVEGGGARSEDEQALRLAERHGVDRVCVVLGSGGDAPRIPYVLTTDVVAVRPGDPLPVAAIVERIAERAEDADYVVASRLPILRRPVAERTVRRVSRQNGLLGAAIFIPGADLPALTLNQIRMVFRIAGAYGERIDRERALELLGVVGAGLGLRAAARQVVGLVPLAGWALKGGIAYAGTRALGEAAIRYFERKGSVRTRS